MSEWSVLVEARSPDGERLNESDGSMTRFIDLLLPHHAATSLGGIYWAARVWVEAPTIEEAFGSAVETVVKAAADAGLPAWPVVRVELADELEFSHDLAKPSFPAIAGVKEVCETLGVSRQRLAELRQTDTFPGPIAHISGSPIWLQAAIDTFLEGWDRRPGRPATKGDPLRRPLVDAPGFSRFDKEK